MTSRTIFLSRFIGLILISVALSMAIQGHWMAETIDTMMRDRPLLYVVGLATMACGLAVVLLHNRWTGGLLPVVVTILGWIMLIKGLLILWLPPQMLVSLFEAAQFGRLLYLYAAIDLVIGIYLTIGGWTARTE